LEIGSNVSSSFCGAATEEALASSRCPLALAMLGRISCELRTGQSEMHADG